ncbi:hypothetical protein KPP23_033 [Pseudomonas phage KPP23]|nr:hypothetical protein KPP23_033 [Pseudomonas phage KPP23]
MKYVMFEKRMSDGCSHKVPVIFPNTLVHDEVANALTLGPLKGYIPCSAGGDFPVGYATSRGKYHFGAQGRRRAG